MPLPPTKYVMRQGETLVDAVVDLDGQWFDGCTFTDYTFMFRGVEPLGYARCEFDRHR